MFTPATQQQQQKQPAAASTPEEEALKRNTDCVYFLASPLTCKKGSECEYRHSEYARINPRDCYYWLNGNCLNPKCGFRHPPLDGLLGNQGGAPTGSVQAPLNAAKQAVPCVFFQKGMCIKGDRCAFFHVQTLVETAVPPVEPESFKKPCEKVTEKKKSPPAKAVKADSDKGSAPKVANGGLRDCRSVERYVPNHVGYEGPKKVVGVPLFTDGSHSDNNNSFHFGKNRDDVVRESSPGFDVLVDNELRDSEYCRGEDQYGRRGQNGKNSVSELDPDFDNTAANGDAEAFHDHHGFDHYNHIQDRQYAWGHPRASSDRGDHLERRGYLTDERSSDHIPESDLRHRLSKHRRIHGRDHLERGFVDSRRDSLQERSIGRRLQGRIKLPCRINGGDTHSERGSWERNTSQSLQGRLRDRIKGKLEDNHSIDHERGTRIPWMRRRDMDDDRNYEFPALKRLAVLKRGKEESKAEPLFRKKRSLDDHLHQESEDSFAAPLPLSEILKRKRAAGIVSGGSSDEKEGKIQRTKQEDKAEVGHDQSSEPKETLEGETDEGTMVDEGMIEDQGYEGDDQNGEYYYEQGYEEDGEYNYEEAENVEEEDGGDEFEKKMGVMF